MQAHEVNETSTDARLSFLSFSFFYILNYTMASKRTKDHKEIHEETISKDNFLDVVNRLVKIDSEMRKRAKETESQKQKYREQKDMLMV